MNHTPGPWGCTNLDEGYGFPRTVYSEATGLSVASLSGANGDLDQWKANARLIAAAPDLLVACEACIPLIANGSLAGDLLRAAIAKARGENT